MKRIINIDKINAIVKNIKNNIDLYEERKIKLLIDIEKIGIYYDGSENNEIIDSYKNVINYLNILVENTTIYINYLEKIIPSYQEIYETSLKNMNPDNSEFINNI